MLQACNETYNSVLTIDMWLKFMSGLPFRDPYVVSDALVLSICKNRNSPVTTVWRNLPVTWLKHGWLRFPQVCGWPYPVKTLTMYHSLTTNAAESFRSCIKSASIHLNRMQAEQCIFTCRESSRIYVHQTCCTQIASNRLNWVYKQIRYVILRIIDALRNSFDVLRKLFAIVIVCFSRKNCVLLSINCVLLSCSAENAC